jgi:ribosomal protein S18 acetylase RimI-like enzyme
VRIRAAVPADVEAIHHVSVASCRAAYEDVLDDDAFLRRVDDPSRVDALRARLDDAGSDGSLVYLVAVDERVVGFLQLVSGSRRPEHVAEDAAYLKSLYVHPDRWRDGIGSRLLDAGLARAPDGLDRVLVGVLAANHVGRELYERRDFERIGTGTFDVGAVTYDTVVYATELR